MNIKSFSCINGSVSEFNTVNLWNIDAIFWSKQKNDFRSVPVLVSNVSEEGLGNVVLGGNYIFLDGISDLHEANSPFFQALLID